MISRKWALLALFLLAVTFPALAQGPKSDYQRSASLQQLFGGKVARDQITPQWIGDTGQFWYRVDLGEGRREYIRVDPQRNGRLGRYGLQSDPGDATDDVLEAGFGVVGRYPHILVCHRPDPREVTAGRLRRRSRLRDSWLCGTR